MDKQKPIYIMSLEASDIYYHTNRNMNIKKEYYGMIPFSLESMKLIDIGLKTTYIENRDKYISNDIINVKFKSCAKSADDMINVIDKKINYAKDENYISELINYREILESHSHKSEDIDNLWDKVSVEDLRKDLYLNGFTMKFKNKRTGKYRKIEYVVYKRSSAKSRTGQCLFIKKSLYKKMISWSRMNLPFKKGQVIDLASLLAYESLVGSSLEDTIVINPQRILMVDDLESKFKINANVVRKNKKTGFLDSFKEESEVTNSLFDGESLLESKYFKKGTSMILLRNHMFKSAAFNCNIQQFLKDNCPEDINFVDWEIKDMFGNKMKASNIDMITTPSSVKSLKFKNVLPTKSEEEMWKYWKAKVEEDGSIFGICKHEKKSKIGIDSEGNLLQQTSYQMINCLPIDRKGIYELTKKEKDYIEYLKTDNDFLIQEIYKSRDVTNSNEVLSRLYQLNTDFADTRMFRKFKKKFIFNKKQHAKKGKIRIKGDYCVLLGNPMELLYHSIDKFNEHPLTLSGNQVYCSLYEDGKKMVGFRNPNTSPSNVLIMKNTYSREIETYLNLTDNIVVVNAINFPIQDILSGCDYDSDTMLVSGEEKLVEIGDKCFGHYNVCLNKIDGEKKKYQLTNEDHYEIDNQLSHSQKIIGRVVNLGQYCMSAYWDLINKGVTGVRVEELLKKVDVMTILSGIAIDMAKKFYDINMRKEIEYVNKNKEISERNKMPMFWTSVSQSKSIKHRVEHYDCPMDYLLEEISSIKDADKTNVIELEDLIKDFSTRHVNVQQIKNVENVIKTYFNKVGEIRLENSDDIRYKLIELENETVNKIKKWKLKSDTISILLKSPHFLGDDMLIKTLKMLYECHVDEFEKVIVT